MYCTVKKLSAKCWIQTCRTVNAFLRGADPWGCASHSPGLEPVRRELETVMQRLDDAFEHGADVTLFTTLFVN